MELRGKDHPFYSFSHGDEDYYCVSADDRLQRIKELCADGLRRVLELPGLQRTVRQAAERRLRRLERASGGVR